MIPNLNLFIIMVFPCNKPHVCPGLKAMRFLFPAAMRQAQVSNGQQSGSHFLSVRGPIYGSQGQFMALRAN